MLVNRKRIPAWFGRELKGKTYFPPLGEIFVKAIPHGASGAVLLAVLRGDAIGLVLLAIGGGGQPGFGYGPVGEVEELGLVEDGDGVPWLTISAEVLLVAVTAELAGEQVVGPVWQDHRLVQV